MESNLNLFFSIIIATSNSESTITECLKSIKEQTYQNFEIIIIDNCSKEKTIEVIKKFNFKNIKIIIEEDRGIYDAINKGVINSTGDFVSILHSNDLYFNSEVLSSIANVLNKVNIDIIYGDLIYVKKNDINLTIRNWKSKNFRAGLFYAGWNPPHPTFIVKRNTYLENKLYDNNLGNSADIESMFRFLETKKYKSFYLNKKLIKMRYGGASNKNLISIINQNIVIINFLKINKNLPKLIYFLVNKFINRLKQFL